MGVFVAFSIIALWLFHLLWSVLQVDVSWSNPWLYLHVLIQAYLYTGLFITGHDAMHRSVSRNRVLNNAVGRLTAWLYAGLSYRKLVKNHMNHHRYPGSSRDPDYCDYSGNFFIWWGQFMIRYITIWQFLSMALIFNIARYLLHIPVASMLVFWILPAFLSTFQLFYFGTYLPHQQPHTEEMGKHRARTLRKNHIWAMLSCYFFGYHLEHHESPGTPWWKLYQSKS